MAEFDRRGVNNLLNTCTHMAIQKKHCFYWQISPSAVPFFEDLIYTRRLCLSNLMANPQRQLSIRLTTCCADSAVRLIGMNLLNNLRYLQIWWLKELDSVYGLKNIDCCFIYECPSMCSFRDASDIKVLRLKHCTRLRDVCGLSNIRSVDLRCCHNLTELRDWKGTMDYIDVSFCSKVTDFTFLKNIKIRKSFQANQCKGLTAADDSFLDIPTVHMTFCENLCDVSGIRNAYAANLSFCNRLNDVSALKNLHSLDLSSCESLTDVSMLGNVFELDLSGCFNVFDVSALTNVKRLCLSNCPRITDVRSLGNALEVELSGCTGLRDVTALSRVPTLDLSYCRNISDIGSLTGVDHLSIEGCKQAISGLMNLAQLKTLVVIGCNSALNIILRRYEATTNIVRTCYDVNDVFNTRYFMFI